MRAVQGGELDGVSDEEDGLIAQSVSMTITTLDYPQAVQKSRGGVG